MLLKIHQRDPRSYCQREQECVHRQQWCVCVYLSLMMRKILIIMITNIGIIRTPSSSPTKNQPLTNISQLLTATSHDQSALESTSDLGMGEASQVAALTQGLGEHGCAPRVTPSFKGRPVGQSMNGKFTYKLGQKLRHFEVNLWQKFGKYTKYQCIWSIWELWNLYNQCQGVMTIPMTYLQFTFFREQDPEWSQIAQTQMEGIAW